jgi:general secretion pathway protein G
MRRIRRFGYRASGAVFVILWFFVILVWWADAELHLARPAIAWATVTTLRRALGLYADDIGSYPTTGQGLQALRTNPGETKWVGPYLRENLPLDPWGRSYVYRFNERGITEILTRGRDGKPGGVGEDADISSFHLDAPLSPESEDALGWVMRVFSFRVAPVCFVGYLIAPSILRRFYAGRPRTCPTRM